MEAVELRELEINLSPIKEDNNELEVQGYIATSEPSHILGKNGSKKWREVIVPGTFSAALAKARMLGQEIDFLADHDNKQILASTANSSLFLEEDEIGLYIDAKISPTTWGKNLFVLVKDGIVKGLSFGMKVLREDWSLAADGIPLRTISEIELFEVSALRTPAYPGTLLENRGLEVAKVEVPNDLEKRDFTGGNSMNNENQEVTPLMMYNGMTLIAEKLDTIIKKMETIDADKTVKGLQEAKDTLTEAKAVADAIGATATNEATVDPTETELDPTTEEVVENKEGKIEGEEVREDDAPIDKEKPDEIADEDVKPEDAQAEDAKPSEEKVDEAVKEEKKVDEKVDEEAEPTDEEVDEAYEENEKKKKQVNEFRSLIKTLKSEVPEID